MLSNKLKNILYVLVCVFLLFCIFGMAKSILFRWKCVEGKCERVLSIGNDYNSRIDCENDCSENTMYSLKLGGQTGTKQENKDNVKDNVKDDSKDNVKDDSKCNDDRCQQNIDYSYSPYAYSSVYPYSDYYQNVRPYVPQSLQWLRRNDYAYNYPKHKNNHYIYNTNHNHNTNHNFNPNNPNPNNPNVPNPNTNPNTNHPTNPNTNHPTNPNTNNNVNVPNTNNNVNVPNPTNVNPNVPNVPNVPNTNNVNVPKINNLSVNTK